MIYVYNSLAVLLCLFVLVGANTTWLQQQTNLALFGAFGMTLVFLSKPMSKRLRDRFPRASRGIDILLMAATVVVFGYMLIHNETLLERFWIDGDSLGQRAGQELWLESALGLVGMILVMEATRRAIGWTLPILCCLFIAYAFYGRVMPDWAFPHGGWSWEQVAQTSFLQESGVFGVALKIMFQYVFLFVLFGTLLEQTGATGYIIDLARRLFRSSSGGPAKVAVVSSGLMGSLSGSAVANTATTGTFTIPLMRSSGFSANAAGGIEAAASSGGALMPPIMGAGAYMMMELVPGNPTYVQIIQAALLPAILYYSALLLTVHFHAKRIGASAESELEEQPSAESNTEAEPTQLDHSAESESAANDPSCDKAPPAVLGSGEGSVFQGLVFFGSFLILIGLLLKGLSPFVAVSLGLFGVIGLSLLHHSTRLTPGKVLTAAVSAAKGGVALIVAASCVGIILAIVTKTGVGNALPPKVLSIAGSSVIAALVLLMFSTIVLGMGLPSAVCYLLMATLVSAALANLSTPTLAAHLFIFYFGMMSMVTPPVALAAYAAAAISKGDVIATAFQAFRFALVGFALPFFFVLNPEILMLSTSIFDGLPTGPDRVIADGQPATWTMMAATMAIVSVAIYGLAAAIAGQARHRLGWFFRAVLLLLSLTVFFTRLTEEFWVQVGSTGVLLALLVWEGCRSKASDHRAVGD